MWMRGALPQDATKQKGLLKMNETFSKEATWAQGSAVDGKMVMLTGIGWHRCSAPVGVFLTGADIKDTSLQTYRLESVCDV